MSTPEKKTPTMSDIAAAACKASEAFAGLAIVIKAATDAILRLRSRSPCPVFRLVRAA